MKKIYLLSILSVLCITIQAQWIQLGADIDSEFQLDNAGSSVSLSADGLTLAIGAPFNGGTGIDAGHVRVYQHNGSNWIQKGADIDSEVFRDNSGYSVSLSADGSILAVGAPGNDGLSIDAGHVRVYHYNDSNWVQLGADIDGEGGFDHSGSSVSLSADGSILAIGAPFHDKPGYSDVGQARIYQYNDSNWVQLGADIDGGSSDDHLGSSISLSADGSILAIGAPGHSISSFFDPGEVSVYEYNDSNWVQLGATIHGESLDDRFGSSVSLSADGSILAIGASDNNGSGKKSGHVRVYQYNSGNWIQLGAEINGEAGNDESGSSVSLSADGLTLAIGAPLNDGTGTDAGHVRVYNYNGNNWIQKAADIDGEAARDHSGFSISLSGDGSILAVGAPLNDRTKGANGGHVRVYKFCQSTTSTDIHSTCGPFTWMDGNTYTANNHNATYTLTNAAGCDSIVTLHLTINSSSSSLLSVVDCNPITLNGNTYSASGTYIDTLTNVVGCDSILTILFSRQTSDTTILVSACENYSFNGVDYSNSGTYIDTMPGCSVTTTLHLTINNASNQSETVVSCEPYLWHGNIYTASGTYVDSLTNVSGCDSVITLDLMITDIDATLTSQGTDLTANTFGASYQWLDCHNGGYSAIVGASEQIYTATENGSYAVEITKNGCVDTSDCQIIASAQSQWSQLGSDIDGEAASDFSGSSVSMSADGSTVAIGAVGNDGRGFNSGHVRIYQYDGCNWIQLGADINGEVSGDHSGHSVSLSSNGLTVAIGAPDNSGIGILDGTGHVRVYQYNGSDWIQLGSDIDAEALYDRCGWSVSLSADGLTLAVGAPKNTGFGSPNTSGHVRVYHYNGSNWIQQGADIDGETRSDQSGTSVSLSADGLKLAIGAPGNGGAGFISGTGHVRVYEYDGSDWTQLGADIDGEEGGDRSGSSVSLSADGLTLAVGAPGNRGSGFLAGPGTGHVRVYHYNGSNWVQQGADIDGEEAGDHSGTSVSLSADGLKLAVGADDNKGPLKSSYNRGHVRMYQFNGSDWIQQGVDIDGEANDDYSGSSVSLSADGLKLAIGAERNNGSGFLAGHVRVYSFCSDTCAVSPITCPTITNTEVIPGNQESEIAIYPNPTNGMVQISMDKLGGISQVVITDIMGQQISTYQFQHNENISFELAGEPGIYFIHVQSSMGKEHIFKVLKQ